jgi:hypothetical protein
MRDTRVISLLALAVAACAPQAEAKPEAQAKVASAASATNPVVVELFQSQGCSSCPPANANLNAIAGRPDVLALSFAVTYWDRLGWKDIYAQQRFTDRQWEYSRAGGRDHVSTPQMIVNGRGVLVGNRPEEVAAFIRKFAGDDSGPALTPNAGRISVGRAKAAGPATVWLVHYDPRTHNVPIRAGENGGRTLPHRNIVRGLERLGAWTGAPASFALAAPRDAALRSAVVVQQGVGGHIIAARKI